MENCKHLVHALRFLFQHSICCFPSISIKGKSYQSSVILLMADTLRLHLGVFDCNFAFEPRIGSFLLWCRDFLTLIDSWPRFMSFDVVVMSRKLSCRINSCQVSISFIANFLPDVGFSCKILRRNWKTRQHDSFP